VTLTRQIDLAGKSGAHYRYAPLDEERFLAPSGANFVIAAEADEGLRVLYVGETESLASRAWGQALEEARKDHPDAFLLTRLNVTRAIRVSEQEDIVALHAPPLNSSAG
jgi:hypothetical protein